MTKPYLSGVRSALRRWHDEGAGGEAVVTELTRAMDRLVRFLAETATIRFRRRYVPLDQRCAVIAQGGYGRGELNPYSDVDLLVLHPRKRTPYVETVAETLFYALFDGGAQVGQALRTVRDCVRLAGADLTVKTALVDARLVWGDEGLADEFFRALERDVKARGSEAFFRAKMLESEARHHAYGDSVYLLEPHLKEGPGGLRDLHTALWIAKIKFKITSLRELVVKGVANHREIAEIEAARDFLFRVRNALHFLSSRHQDQLTFEVQETIAENLGYRAVPGERIKPVERFLRDYYLHALAVTRFSEIIIDRAVNPPRPSRLIGRMRARTIRPGVRIVGGELTITEGEIFSRDPVELLRLFLDAQRHRVRFAPGLADAIRRNAERLGEGERRRPDLAEVFLEILRQPARVYETLHEMHRLGVLTRLLPEWEHLLCLVLHDQYHIYTVDQHSLMGIRELERLRSGEHAGSSKLLTQVMQEVERVELLYLGMLMHDSGKGLGGGHSEKGARFAHQVATRLGLNQDDVAEVETLVREHLAMSHLAQRRDLHDDRLLLDFARRIGSLETAKRLFLLTYADMRATGPKVWNNWKDMLLGETYLRLQELFARGLEPEDRAARVARIRSRAIEAAASRGGPAAAARLARHLDGMPDSYVLSTPEVLLEVHADLVERARREALATDLRHARSSDFSEFTVVTRDRPGLFALLTGVLAASRVNILAARVATSRDGWAVDAFRVVPLEAADEVREGERWARTRALLADVIAGRRELASELAEAERPGILDRPARRAIGAEVVVDESASEEFSVVEVYAPDRLGLLHRVASALFDLGLEISLAKITTNVDHVLDVFYVREEGGAKPRRAGEIRRALLAAVEEGVTGGEGRAAG